MRRILIFSVVILLICSETISLGIGSKRDARKSHKNGSPDIADLLFGDLDFDSFSDSLDLDDSDWSAEYVDNNKQRRKTIIYNRPFGGISSRNRVAQLPSTPWWLGPNVCVENYGNLTSQSLNRERLPGLCKSSRSFTSDYGPIGSCMLEADKRICIAWYYDDLRRIQPIKEIQKCCHGYGRTKILSAFSIYEPCEKLNLLSLIETSERLNGSEFVHAAQKNGIENEMKQNVTLFMPTDAVFTEFTTQTESTDKTSDISTKSIIMNHIVSDMVSIENEQLLVTKYENRTIRINIFRRPPPVSLQPPQSSFTEYDERLNIYTANCVPISKLDQQAENGIVHVVDRVLMPVTKSLMELIRLREDMAVLRAILEKTDLAEQLENSNKIFTLFAPTDKAFEKLDLETRRIMKKGKACALNILKNHILDMTFCSSAIFEGVETSVINSIGEKLIMENAVAKSSTATKSLAGKMSIMINGKSQITATDIMATNGVMHVIDTFLPTNSSLPLTSMLESHNGNLFGKLLKLNGINDLVDSYENVVVFAPTDSALQTTEWAKKIESDPKSLKGDAELTKFLQNHIAKPSNKTCELSSENSMETKTGDLLQVKFYPTSSGTTINCARLVQSSVDSCGSILYQIDQPIQSSSQTIFEILKANGQYSMFLELLETANLTSLLKDQNRSLTVLIPKNDVFTELKTYFNELTTKGNEKKLENTIKTYIIDGALCCTGMMNAEWIHVGVARTINNIFLNIYNSQRPAIENASIIKCDIMATNGIIHEINDVINTSYRITSQI